MNQCLHDYSIYPCAPLVRPLPLPHPHSVLHYPHLPFLPQSSFPIKVFTFPQPRSQPHSHSRSRSHNSYIISSRISTIQSKPNNQSQSQSPRISYYILLSPSQTLISHVLSCPALLLHPLIPSHTTRNSASLHYVPPTITSPPHTHSRLVAVASSSTAWSSQAQPHIQSRSSYPVVTLSNQQLSFFASPEFKLVLRSATAFVLSYLVLHHSYSHPHPPMPHSRPHVSRLVDVDDADDDGSLTHPCNSLHIVLRTRMKSMNTVYLVRLSVPLLHRSAHALTVECD